MVNQNLGAKKYLACNVTVIINEGSVNKLQKCLKPSIIAFATIPRQLTMICCFFASETKLPKN